MSNIGAGTGGLGVTPGGGVTYDPFDGGLVFDYNPVKNSALTGTCNPLENTARDVRVADGGVVATAGTSDWTRTSRGLMTNSTAYRTLVSATSLPAIGGNMRFYSFNVYSPDSTNYPTNGDNIRLVFNYDGSTGDCWALVFNWTGTVFQLILNENTAWTPTARATLNASSELDIGMYCNVWLYEWANTILFGFDAFETDNPLVDHFSYSGEYNVGSRPYQTNTGFIYGMGALGGTPRFYLNRLTIHDMD